MRYRHNGRPRKLTLEGFPPLATARKLAAAAIENPERDPAAEKRARKTQDRDAAQSRRDLFPDVVDAYLRHYEAGRATRKNVKPKPRTIAETRRLLASLITPDVWGEKRIQEITKRDVIEVLDGIVDRGAPYVANRTHAAISPLFAWAVQRDMIEVSPVIWKKAAEEARERYLTPEEIKLFWTATESLGHLFRAIFRLLLLTGQRKSEVADMTESEIELQKRQWTIPGERTKNRRDHLVPLSEPVIEILRSVPRITNDRGLIFTTNGRTPPSGFTKPIKTCRARMIELAGEQLPSWTLHDLRRTVSTLMHEEIGIDPHVVEATLNHVSGAQGGVAGVYNRARYLKQKEAALAAWGRYVLMLVSGETGQNVVSLTKK